MTVDEKGAVSGGGDANANAETSQAQAGAEQATQTNSEIELIKKELSGRDQKIAELLKNLKAKDDALQAKEMAGKTAEEKLAILEKQLAEHEQEKRLKEALSEAGLSSSDWEGVFKGGDLAEQAKRASALIKKAADEAAEKAREELKAKTLSAVSADVPKTNSAADDKLTAAFRSGAGL